MKPFKLTFTFLISLVLLYTACNSESNADFAAVDTHPQPDSRSRAPSTFQPKETSAIRQTPQPAGPDERITIVDHGLNIPQGSYQVPQGWNVMQDIATDPETGTFARYKLDFVGPRGELIHSIGVASYYELMGQNFQQTWHQMVENNLPSVVSGLNYEQMQPSLRMQQLIAEKGLDRNGQCKGFEMPFSGHMNGRPVEGLIYLLDMQLSQGTGTIASTAVISPKGMLKQTLAIDKQLADSYQPDSKYQQRLQQIAAQNAQLNQYQQNRQTISRAYDQQNQRWSENFNSGDPSSKVEY